METIVLTRKECQRKIADLIETWPQLAAFKDMPISCCESCALMEPGYELGWENYSQEMQAAYASIKMYQWLSDQ